MFDIKDNKKRFTCPKSKSVIGPTDFDINIQGNICVVY